MMLKKRYIITALGVVSVLLVSLLYTNLALAGEITPSGKPQPEPIIYKDAIEIEVFGWATRQYTYDSSYPKDQGIYVQDDYTADFSFIFLPKQNLVNITNMVVVICASASIDLVLTINNDDFSVGYISFIGSDLVSAKRIPLNPSLVQLNEGINSLTVSGSSGNIQMYKLSLFIEYEYQS